MNRKFLPDMGIAALVLVICLGAGLLPAGRSIRPEIPAPARPLEPAGSGEKTPWAPPVSEIDALMQRNLFSATGRYDAFPGRKGGSSLPEGACRLEAVFLGQEKKALFRKDTGELRIFTAGARLPDGAVLVEILPRAVSVKRGEKIETITLFDVTPGGMAPKKGGGG